MSFRPYPVMTVLTLISLGILIWLGNWQYGRFLQKMALDKQEPEWVVLDGTIVPDTEMRVYFYANGQSGWMRVVGIDTGEQVVFAPVELVTQVDPVLACDGKGCAAGRFSARGIFKPPFRRNAFTAADDVPSRLFYALDPAEFAKALPADVAARIAPDVFEPETLTIVSETGTVSVGENPYARLRLDDELPPQRHFGYAITWWGLAFALIGVYLAFHHQKGRLRFRKERGS
ncbi:MAG: SURF1 family cytochrome oxidase biogenesis protein [Hyphomonas sp.]|uniref:SURF1 family cytochrome oxidase biogenesis protein n=1 Tax=Hyphomonas sp. TaxID=87 RepID=UPI00352784D4